MVKITSLLLASVALFAVSTQAQVSLEPIAKSTTDLALYNDVAALADGEMNILPYPGPHNSGSRNTLRRRATTAAKKPKKPTKKSTVKLTKEEQTILDTHNKFRALHQAPPLTWNAKSAAFGNNWIQACEFKHSGGPVSPPSLFPKICLLHASSFLLWHPCEETSLLTDQCLIFDELFIYSTVRTWPPVTRTSRLPSLRGTMRSSTTTTTSLASLGRPVISPRWCGSRPSRSDVPRSFARAPAGPSTFASTMPPVTLSLPTTRTSRRTSFLSRRSKRRERKRKQGENRWAMKQLFLCFSLSLSLSLSTLALDVQDSNKKQYKKQ